MVEIINPSTDPAFNLATEEYLLAKEKVGDILMIWRNRPSVIIGKFQNFYEEVSPRAIYEKNVDVCRRNSGGGTVYHDLGNINFTMISDKGENSPDYVRFLSPVVEFLHGLGVPAEIDSSNAITVHGLKISGNAQSVQGGRVMHHGTLLFDVELGALSSLTGSARERITSRSIKSNPSPVCNIRPLLKEDMDSPSFMSALSRYFSDIYGEYTSRELTEEEIREIESLADSKYRTWEWNFGKCPEFTLTGRGFTVVSKHGVIIGASSEDEVLAKALCGLVNVPLIPQSVEAALEKSGILPEETVARIIEDLFV